MKNTGRQYFRAFALQRVLRRTGVKRILGLFLVLSMSLASTACVDLTAIQKFTASATEVGKRFPNLAKDLSASCRRQHIYQRVREAQFEPAKLAEITHPEKDSDQAKWLDAQCKDFKEQEERLTQANAVLINYLKTMGDLAADDLTSHDKALDGLATSFTDANIFNAPEVGAVKALVGFLTNAVSEGYRRKKLKQALESQNSNIQTLVGALKRIVTQKYVLQLQNERDQLRSYYGTSILEYRQYMRKVAQNAGANPDDVRDPLPIIQVKRLWDDEEITLAERMSAAQAYGKALDTIAEGHQKLFDSRNDLNSKQVQATALAYAQTIQSIVEDFRKAF